jgi:hypothetical protein
MQWLFLLPLFQNQCFFLRFSQLHCAARRIWWPFPQMIDAEHTERYIFSFEKAKPELWFSEVLRRSTSFFIHLITIVACYFEEETKLNYASEVATCKLDYHLGPALKNWLPVDGFRCPLRMSSLFHACTVPLHDISGRARVEIFSTFFVCRSYDVLSQSFKRCNLCLATTVAWTKPYICMHTNYLDN